MERLTVKLVLLLCLQSGIYAVVDEYEYLYKSNVAVTNGAYDEAVSQWTLSGKLVVQSTENHLILQWKELNTSLYNGPSTNVNDALEKPIPVESKIIYDPFVLHLYNGKISSLSHLEDEPIWSINMKKAVANIFNIDDYKTHKNVQEQTLFGVCNVNYELISSNNEKKVVSVIIDHDKCTDLLRLEWANARSAPVKDLHDPIHMNTKRVYTIQNGLNKHLFTEVESLSNITYEPTKGARDTQHVDSSQTFTLLSHSVVDSEIDITKNTINTNLIYKNRDHIDVLHRERRPEKNKTSEELVADFIKNYQEFDKQFSNVPLTTYNVKYNQPLDNIYYNIHQMDETGLKTLVKYASYTDDKDLIYIVGSLLPYIGTNNSVQFIKELILSDKLKNLFGSQLMTTFPLYVNTLSEELLTDLEILKNLSTTPSLLKKVGVLSFATLVSKANNDGLIGEETIRKYVKEYYDLFVECDDVDQQSYEKKMTYLLGLINMGNSLESDLIISIITNPNISRHLRTLGIYGFKNHLITKPDIVFENFWPVINNKSEVFNVRIAALDLLLSTNLTKEQFNQISEYFVNKIQKNDVYDKHFKNYYITTLMSLQNSTGYFDYLGDFATEKNPKFERKYNRVWTTGNYRMSYTDSEQNFGEMYQTRLVSNPLTNAITSAQFTFNQFAMSFDLGTYTVYLCLDGLIDFVLSDHINFETPVPHLLKLLLDNNFRRPPKDDVHLELVIYLDDRAIFNWHLDRNGFGEMPKSLLSELENILPTYTFVTYPLADYKTFTTDLGTAFETQNDMQYISSHEIFPNYYYYRTSLNSQQWLSSYNPLGDVYSSTYKYFGGENRFQFPVQINSTNWSLELKHKNDTFNAVMERLYGTSADNQTTLEQYCSNCKEIYGLPTPVHTSEIMPLKVLGFKCNLTIASGGDRINATDVIEDVVNSHQTNFLSEYSPLFYNLHLVNYIKYKQITIGSVVIKSLPFYDEPTESIFDVSLIADNVYTKSDFMNGTEIGFEIKQQVRFINDSVPLSNFSAAFQYLESSELHPHLKDEFLFQFSYSDNETSEYKVSMNREMLYPKRRIDKFSMKPVEPTAGNIKISWGLVNSSEENTCPTDRFVKIYEKYAATEEQTKQAKKLKEYGQCKKDSIDLKYTPPTEACLVINDLLSKYTSYKIYANFNHSGNLAAYFSKRTLNDSNIQLLEFNSLDQDRDTQIKIANVVLDVFNHKSADEHSDFTSIDYSTNMFNFFAIDPTADAYDDLDVYAGIKSSCFFTSHHMKTFTDLIINNYNKPETETVAFMECTNTTSYGLTIQKISTKKIGFTFWFKGRKLTATTNENNKLKLLLDDELQTKENAANAIDIKIYYLDDDVVYITDTKVELLYNMEYLLIKSISLSNNVYCGLCSRY